MRFALHITFYIANLIKAFPLIDQGTFHQLLKYCCPNLTDKDIPRHKTVRAEIMCQASVAEENVRKTVKVSKVGFSH